jgi:hypothetical protein
VIVGRSPRAGEFSGRACRWTSAGGVEELNTFLPTMVDFLYQATATSPDGRWIVGEGSHDNLRQAYLFDSQGL